MSEFSVSLAAIGAAVAATRGVGVDLGEELQRLAGEVEAVVGGGWRGPAATAFTRSWEQWRSGAADVIAALERMGELLAETGSAYAWRDDTASEQLRRAAP